MAKVMLLRDKAYDLIMEKIISGDYKMGSYLDEKSISNEIGINRTPVREALIKIEHIGLVEIMPQKGIYVCRIGYKDVFDHYNIRMFIEPYLILSSGALLDDKKLVEFKTMFQDQMHGNDEMALFELDNDFHAYLLSISNNKYLDSIINALSIEFIRMRIISHVNSQMRTNVCFQHIDIIDAVLNKDYKSASRLLENHINQSKEENLSAYIKATQE